MVPNQSMAPGGLSGLYQLVLALVRQLQLCHLMLLQLKQRNAVLERTLFGRRSERLRPVSSAQLSFAFEAQQTLVPQAKEAPAAGQTGGDNGDRPDGPPRKRRSSPRPRKPFPADLPREVVEHRIGACPDCGGTCLSQVGEDRREVLEFIPAAFKIIEHVRPRLRCRDCQTTAQAPPPALPIARAMVGPALLAHVIVAKYGDHAPLHRQSVIYARQGVALSRQLLSNHLKALAPLLARLSARIGAHVLAGDVFHIDDTRLPVLEKQRTREGRLWCVVRDERPWNGPAPPAAFYHHAPNKAQAELETLLQHARGYMQADADTRYTRLYAETVNSDGTAAPRLREVACWAHARRRFFDAWVATGSEAAREVLALMAKLFAVEARIRGCPPALRRSARRHLAKPRLDKLHRYLLWAQETGSTAMPLADGVNYMLGRWEAFVRYVQDGRLEMTNNAAERALRMPVTGRKNWSFVGSDAGGARAAVYFTLVETCRLNGIDPEAYLRDIIARIADHPVNRLDELLPWVWAAQRP